MSNSRGPLRSPTSIRGERERKQERRGKKKPQQASATPSMPSWMPTDAVETWGGVVNDLTAAMVPLQRIDAHSIAMFVLTIIETKKAAVSGDSKLAARLGRDALQWAGHIGATPASRARLNIKPPKVVEDDPWADLDRPSGK